MDFFDLSTSAQMALLVVGIVSWLVLIWMWAWGEGK